MNNFNELYPILEQFGYYDADIGKVHLMDECGCLSDVTLDPCHLDIEITTMLSFTYETQEKLNEHIRDWAKEERDKGNLYWKGCCACCNYLDVDCRLFNKEKYLADWAIPEPVKQVLVNSALYTGKDAIDKLNSLVSGEPPYTPIIVHIASQMKGMRRKSFLVAVRKIDSYKDYIEIYTNVGVLPLYTDAPTPITKDIVEAIEVPNKRD